MADQPDHDRARLNRLLIDHIGDKWTILVLDALCPGPARFNEIKRHAAGVTQKTLTQCLRRLERNGIVSRRIIEAKPLGVEYEVTDLGQTLAEPFAALYRWAADHSDMILKAQRAFDDRS